MIEPRPNTKDAHCSECSRTYVDVVEFDRHRSNGACLDPAKASQIKRNGLWGTLATHTAKEAFRARVASGKAGK